MNKIIAYPVRFIDTLLDRAVSIVCAVVFAQIPQFILLYQQRLGGRVDELARLIDQYRSAAVDTGKSLEAFIQIHTGSTVPEFARTGRIMLDNLDRFNSMKSALDALSSASPGMKFFVFIKTINIETASSTIKTLTPGVPFSLEGLVYASIGLVFGMILYAAIKKILAVLGRKLSGRGPGREGYVENRQ